MSEMKSCETRECEQASKPASALTEQAQNEAYGNKETTGHDITDRTLPVADSTSTRVRIHGDRAELLGSSCSPPDGTPKGDTDPNKEMTVTIMVKSKASEAEMDRDLEKIASKTMNFLSRNEFENKYSADADSLKRVLDFAKDSGLRTEAVDASSGRVQLKGTVADLSKAFQCKLVDYDTPSGVVHARTGTFSVPKKIAGDVEGVLGLDNRQVAKSHARVNADQTTGASTQELEPRAAGGYLPNQIADAYEFPKDGMGQGQSAAIIELGGGINTNDNAVYYKDHGLELPKINVVTVDGAKNAPGDPSGADGEVMLDTQVIGAIAPKAEQMLLFAPNSDQGFVDAVTRATFTKPEETKNTAISISWGSPESQWTDDAIHNMDLAFKKAALQGISIFAASGDNGAKDNSPDRRYNADYPSSDPYVTGCGGTRLSIGSGGKIQKEVTWNDGAFGGATGGGISEKFPVPDYQKGITLPANANHTGKPGRGVPDVSGDASPSTGYRVRVDGREASIGGTSAVSPLYTGLTMRLNSALGRPIGYANPFFYKNGGSGIFRDITEGNNSGYNAGPGWDAATGWGTPNGKAMLDAFRRGK